MSVKLWERNLRPPMELLLLGAAVKTGLFEALRYGPLFFDQLKEKTDSDPKSLRVVVEALISVGYLEWEGVQVKLSPEAMEMFYDGRSENYTGFSFMHGYELCKSWLDLPEVIKTGKAVQRERSPEAMKSFIQSMALHSKKVAPVIAAHCLEGIEKGTVLDIGGGPLTYAREFASLGFSVTVLDLPGVVEMIMPSLKEGENIVMEPGDLTVALPSGPFDLAYLGNICHIFDGEVNKKLFKRVHDALRPGGRMAIQDFVRGVSPGAEMFGVNMLVNTSGGGTWTKDQYSEWIAGAGFSSVEMRNYGERQLITAQRY